MYLISGIILLYCIKMYNDKMGSYEQVKKKCQQKALRESLKILEYNYIIMYIVNSYEHTAYLQLKKEVYNIFIIN